MWAFIKLLIVNLVLNLWGETVFFARTLWQRVQGVWEHVYGLFTDVAFRIWSIVSHIVMVPVHVFWWVWDCLRASWNALASIWKK
jgi:phage-related protein